MWSLFRIVLFLVGVAIIFLYIEFKLYNLGVLFWFIPVFGLALMGINLFGPTETKQDSNEEVKHREIRNIDDSHFTILVNPNNDVQQLIDFIYRTNNLTSLIFNYEGNKQIVNGSSLKDDILSSYSLIENRRKTFRLNEIRQIKRVNGNGYFWERHKLRQDFTQIRDYFKRYVTTNDSDFIRFRGGDNGNYIYSWKLSDNLISDFQNKGEGEKLFYKYITLNFHDFFLKSSNQNVIKKLVVENNHIVAFDYERNEKRIFYVENVFEYEILYS